MSQELEQRIRERAYELWAMSGYSHGQDEEHWCAAEREIVAAMHVPAKPKKKSGTKIAGRRHRRLKPAARKGRIASQLTNFNLARGPRQSPAPIPAKAILAHIAPAKGRLVEPAAG